MPENVLESPKEVGKGNLIPTESVYPELRQIPVAMVPAGPTSFIVTFGPEDQRSILQHQAAIRSEFEAALEQWLSEIRYESDSVRILRCDAYLRLIGFGPQALPFLRENQLLGVPFLDLAIKSITREDWSAGRTLSSSA